MYMYYYITFTHGGVKDFILIFLKKEKRYDMILLRKVQSINFSLQIEYEIDLYNPFKSTFKAKMEHISPLLREKIGFRSRIMIYLNKLLLQVETRLYPNGTGRSGSLRII